MDLSELIPVASLLWAIMTVFMCLVADYGRNETKKRASRVFLAIAILVVCWLFTVFFNNAFVVGNAWTTIAHDMLWWIPVSVTVGLVVAWFAGIALLVGRGLAQKGKPRWMVVFPSVSVPGLIFAPILYWLS